MKCTHPILIENPHRLFEKEQMIPVRCGKCEGCLKSKINDWVFRLEQESRQSLYVHFVTLTYSPAFVPLSENLLPTLDKTDVQKYIKRLRKKYGKNLKYFAVGEYGSTSYRPHYHLIIYNVSDPKDLYKKWSLNGKEIGGVHIGDDIANGAIPYTLKYMYKKGLIPAFIDDDRQPEFRLMSNKLGANYLTKQMLKWHLNDLPNRQYVVNKSGFKIGLPKYYRDKIVEQYEGAKIGLRPKDSVYETKDDDDYRTLKSRVEAKRTKIVKFQKKRNQEQRKKL